MHRYKYPRTPHLPFSEGATSDDRILSSDSHFYDMDEVVVTIKMDGENTTIYPNGFYHARSLDSAHRDYHSWLLSYIPTFCYCIPENHRICGEYLYAKHSIGYYQLPSYFEVFSIWNEETCLDWKSTVDLCQKLWLVYVPVVYIGKYDSDHIEKLAHSLVAEGQEGIVVRNASSFQLSDFSNNIAKFVRPNHVQTDEHWSNGIIAKNSLQKL